ARRPVGGTSPPLGVTLGVEAQSVQSQEPDDEEEGAPRSAGEEAAPGRAQRLAGEDTAAPALEPPGAVQGPPETEASVAAELSEDRRAREDSLIPVIVSSEPITDAVDPGDEAQAHRWLGEQVLERAAHDRRVGERPHDARQRVLRWERVGVQEEQHVTA